MLNPFMRPLSNVILAAECDVVPNDDKSSQISTR